MGSEKAPPTGHPLSPLETNLSPSFWRPFPSPLSAIIADRTLRTPPPASVFVNQVEMANNTQTSPRSSCQRESRTGGGRGGNGSPVFSPFRPNIHLAPRQAFLGSQVRSRGKYLSYLVYFTPLSPNACSGPFEPAIWYRIVQDAILEWSWRLA